MKKLVLSLILICASFYLVCAQVKDHSSWKLNSVSFSTGETALTSGNTFSGILSKDNSILIVDYNATLGELIYFYTPNKSKWLSFGPSGGFVKNTPWFAPITNLSLFKEHVTLLSWVGWSFGNPEKEGTSREINFCFSYQQISLLYLGFEAYYANQIYQRNPMEHIGGIKKSFNLNKNISTFVGGGYMLNAEKYLWSTGLKYLF